MFENIKDARKPWRYYAETRVFEMFSARWIYPDFIFCIHIQRLGILGTEKIKHIELQFHIGIKFDALNDQKMLKYNFKFRSNRWKNNKSWNKLF